MSESSSKQEMETMDCNSDEKYPEESNKDMADDSESDDAGDGLTPYSCWHVVSNVIFVISSSLYLALAITALPEARFYRDVPVNVLYATDDATWLNYFNETDAIPPQVLTATDDYTWSLWYNESFYEDDTVFQVNESKPTTAVTQYMILYFLAAFGFLCTGLLETCMAVNIKYKMMYMVFVIAAAFGVASSMLVVADPYMAAVLNAVSVHLFAVEAVAAAVKTCNGGRLDGRMDYTLITGHLSLVVGTMMDVVLSYFYVFDQASLPHARGNVAAACFWLLCSLIYLWSSLQERKHARDDYGKGAFDDDKVHNLKNSMSEEDDV
jgi:hypothetical protein